MNWYKNHIKTAAKTIGYRTYKSGDLEYVRFYREDYSGRNFDMITIEPIPAGTVSNLNYVDIFRREYGRHNVTNIKGEPGQTILRLAEKSEWEEKEARKPKLTEPSEPVVKPTPEQLTLDFIPKKKPLIQPEFNFSSKRSRFLHQKIGKIKGGLGDGMTVDKVDREELIMGIEVELEHVGKGVDISHELITKFVDNQLQGKSEKLSHQDILQAAQDIAMDHFYEIDDYYTRLKTMEQEAKDGSDEKKAKPNVSDNTE